MALTIDQPPAVFSLSPGLEAWALLSREERLYAHHSARAAWYGSRITMDQTSPESGEIFDLIVALHQCCGGNWQALITSSDEAKDLEGFLNYAAVVLDNVGNYAGKGNQKLLPSVKEGVLLRLCQAIDWDDERVKKVVSAICSTEITSLGYPDDTHQSTYYPGDRMTADEVEGVTAIATASKIGVENTRIVKKVTSDAAESSKTLASYTILQASAEASSFTEPPRKLKSFEGSEVQLTRGDHAIPLRAIVNELDIARERTKNVPQILMLTDYIRFFDTGDLRDHRASQKLWLQDRAPKVEMQFGFIEPYRDPAGVRGEFEGIVGMVDQEESKNLLLLAQMCEPIIETLPWIEKDANGGMGPWENNRFEAADFSCLNVLVYCSSTIFAGLNLPNYNDIRETAGSKNLLIPKVIEAHSTRDGDTPAFIHPDDLQSYLICRTPVYRLQVVIHELLGHGTGSLLVGESLEGLANFDVLSPPLSPLTGKEIGSWYEPGQTFNSVFGDLAATVDECRAECVGYYLLDNPALLSIFGFDEHSKITPAEIEYNGYLQLVVAGIKALADYDPTSKRWGQPHSRAHFAMLNAILAEAGDLIFFERTPPGTPGTALQLKLDRAKLRSHGKEGLRKLLLHLHVYRSSADVATCRSYYGALTEVDARALEWRAMVLALAEPRQVFVQANTFLKGNGDVELREYPATVEGVVRSWAERA